ncbi:glutamate-5-semialdehyde dehydrogenase [Ruficoccus amylovorans]|uniref:Gamma-glutamyl phosphate reductase n=1 Tax=Ruficoccus amylovorans TaxID=1804625 RepID=A0A842HK66_9BACT|nr:glutamate-5-semialdehyde dehydrogenase [Ruficoccus amylovorans]MBC2595551.1 glutamate-5-semialdehyde dehydrogenase [Ruficoccus amylovorans]
MKETDSIHELVEGIARQARAAALQTAVLSTEQKNRALNILADLIEENAALLLNENARDLSTARSLELAKPMIERLTFTPERIKAMAAGVREVAALPDPVGEELERTVRPNGLDIRKVRVPIGVIGIIYESRPNVTVDCAVLCLKSGNACILRGGKEAIHSNLALAELIRQALQKSGLPEHAVQIIPTTDRYALNELLKLSQYVHCIIPRGGEGLIRFITENSRIPVIKHFDGICSVYVDKAADPAMAVAVTVNAKTQRVSVCNAAENLFIHRACAPELLPAIARALREKDVELRVDDRAAAILEPAGIPTVPATEDDYRTEYLDAIIAIKVVDSVEEAITDINQYGSGHSESIITADAEAARLFLAGVDASTVYHNASTRFTDGNEFGLGAEIGISTDRLHARGPMGLRELCTYKYQVHGTGQIK